MGTDFKCGCRRAITGAWFLCEKHADLIEQEGEQNTDEFEQGELENEERRLNES